jgi:hypothetical protein
MSNEATIALLQEQNRVLRIKNETLLEELCQAMQALHYSSSLPEWLPSLSGKEIAVLRHLISRDVATAEGIRFTLYQGNVRDEHLPYIWIHKLRRKLTPHAIEIVTVRGEKGWRLSAESRSRLRTPFTPSALLSTASATESPENDHDRIATRDVPVSA